VGKARDVLAEIGSLPVRIQPDPRALRTGIRQTTPDGAVTVLEWPERATKRARAAPVVDRSPQRVTD
jgi:hypothetical protein